MKDHTKRLQINAASKLTAEHDGEEWTAEQLEWLQSWDGTDAYLRELAELLGRTIEACREKFHKSNRTHSWTHTVTVTRTETYRGWTEKDGDGW